MALFENYDRRIDKINGVLAQYGIESVEECREMCQAKGFDPYEIVKGIQPICFENACWAYTVGAAIAMKKGVKTAAEAATAIGEGLQAFCIDGSVADDRKVGLGHGNLGAMLLSDEYQVLLLPRRPRVLRRRRGRHRHRQERQQGPQGAPARHPATALARTPPRSSPVSTASPMSRPSLTTTPAS